MRIALCALAFLLGGSFSVVAAPIVSVTGSLDPENPNDVFLLAFEVEAPGNVVIQSWGYGGGVNAAGTTIPEGGFDGYMSLFSGVGPGALFLASDDDSGCPPVGGLLCRDPRLVLTGLAPGLYTVALGVFLNMSFAENLGTGTLGDGFIGLGSYYDWDVEAFRTSAFALDIDGARPYTPPVAEPSVVLLLCAAAVIRRAHRLARR